MNCRGTAVPRDALVQRPPEQRSVAVCSIRIVGPIRSALQPGSHKPPTHGRPPTSLPARRAGRHRWDITLRELSFAGRIGIAATASDGGSPSLPHGPQFLATPRPETTSCSRNASAILAKDTRRNTY